MEGVTDTICHPATSEGSNDIYPLPSVLDLTQAKPLLEILMAQSGDRPRTLDASAVERMSTPCAQILLAAGRAADRDGHTIRIAGASDVFRTALADLGLTSEFKNWMI